MKHSIGHRRAFLLWAAPLAGALLASPSAVAQNRIRLCTLLPQGSSQYQVLEKMGQDWRKATHDAVTLTIYGGGSMGGEDDCVKRMRIGQIQVSTLSVGGLSKIDSGVGALQKIPALYLSLDEEEFARTKMSTEMEHRLEQKGFVVLFWGDAGWVHIFSRQPILRPGDLKKTKLFVTADDPDEGDIIKGLGIQAVPLNWTDVLISLQSGLLDAVPTTPFLAEAGQYDLVAKHMLQLNYVPLIGATVITKKAWDAINPANREEMRKIALEAGRQIQIRSRDEASPAIEAMKKRSGLQIHTLTPELDAEWRQFLEGVYPKVRGNLVPADVFDQMRELLILHRMMGTWKLNEAKSKLTKGMPKNTKVVYEDAGDKVKITVDGTDGEGKTMHNEWTGKFDGKDYPVTGDATSDARSVKKIDDHTLTFAVKKGGKETRTGRIVFSSDAKSRTVTTNGTDSKGMSVTSIAVYDKQ